jgi:hypothetical protein
MSRFLCFVLAFLLLAGCDYFPSVWPSGRFDAAMWRKATESERYVFAKDIVESKILLSRTKEEVIALLGQPSYESPTGDYVTYVVKTHSIFLLDIRFEKSGQQSKAVSVFIRPA